MAAPPATVDVIAWDALKGMSVATSDKDFLPPPLGDRPQPPRLDDLRIRVTAEARDPEHAVPFAKSFGPNAERVHDPGELEARTHGIKSFRRLIMPHAHHAVGVINSGRANADADLTRSGVRVGLFHPAQSLVTARFRDQNALHSEILTNMLESSDGKRRPRST